MKWLHFVGLQRVAAHCREMRHTCRLIIREEPRGLTGASNRSSLGRGRVAYSARAPRVRPACCRTGFRVGCQITCGDLRSSCGCSRPLRFQTRGTTSIHFRWGDCPTANLLCAYHMVYWCFSLWFYIKCYMNGQMMFLNCLYSIPGKGS